jgi:aminoglycoside 3-N-acetyltransferase
MQERCNEIKTEKIFEKDYKLSTTAIRQLENLAITLNGNKTKIVYLYTNFRMFGEMVKHQFNGSKESFLEFFVEIFLKQNLTIVIPTFTYTSEGIFRVESTNTNLGALNRFIQKREGSSRSEHPIFSYAALGTQQQIVQNIGKSAFGENSIFHRLHQQPTHFIHFGRALSEGNTIVHYLEQTHKVNYRFEKTFPAEVWNHSRYLGSDYTAFVRRQDNPNNNYATRFENASSKLLSSGAMISIEENSAPINLTHGNFNDVYNCLEHELRKSPEIFIK